jgi:hypothetical protein
MQNQILIVRWRLAKSSYEKGLGQNPDGEKLALSVRLLFHFTVIGFP